MSESSPQSHIYKLLEYIGENPDRDGLRDTPDRVIKSYERLFAGYKQKPEDVLSIFGDIVYDEMIVVKDIEFYSTCEHHLLPFFGKAHVGYIPDGTIVGLSTLPRLVEMFARRLQNQERLSNEIAQALSQVIKPKGVGVVLEAQHFCIMARGVEKQQSSVMTSSLIGLFKEELNTRNEFLRLIGK